MAAAIGVRNTRQLGDAAKIQKVRIPVAAGVKIYAGTATVVRAGYLRPATATAGDISAGMACATYDNTAGAAGAVIGEVERGTFGLSNGAGADEITQAHVFQLAYFLDDQSVSSVATARSAAGRIMQLENGQVFVELGTTA